MSDKKKLKFRVVSAFGKEYVVEAHEWRELNGKIDFIDGEAIKAYFLKEHVIAVLEEENKA